MRCTTKILLFVALCSFVPTSRAAVTPVSVAVISPIQFPPRDFTIVGARVSALWGRVKNMYGLDLSLVGNITDNDFVGIGVSGIYNLTRGYTTVTGLQLAGFANLNRSKTKIVGLQLAALNYNKEKSWVLGLQLGLINFAQHTKIMGIQFGLYNTALSVYGFQIGIINQADSLHGIQIGLINFNKSGPFSVCPVINVGF